MKKAIVIALVLMMTLAGYGFGQTAPDGFIRINGGTFTMGR